MNEIVKESLLKPILDLQERTRILHVDDDSSLLKITQQCLEMEASFHIETATSVDEALTKLEKEKYDVIVSDYLMPVKDGLEFLKELREKGNTIPFIIFTGKGREEVAIKALNLGADQYLNKIGDPGTVYCELAHAISGLAERKRAQEAKEKAACALKETQILMGSIFNSTKDMIWSVNADDFRLLTFNKAVSDYFLRTQNLVLKAGLDQYEIMPTEQLAKRWIELNKQALREGSLSIEYTTLKDPTILEITFNVLKHGEKPFAIAVFAKDITERKKAEERIKQSEQRYRELFECAYDVILVVDPDGKVNSVNNAISRYGYRKEDIIGKTILDFVPQSYHSVIMKDFSEAVQGKHTKNKIEIETLNQKVVAEYNASPITREGHIVGVQVVMRGIDERKQ